MHKNIISYIAAVFALSITLDVSAAPLPVGTKLSVTTGSGSGFNLRCTVGSCFGIEIAPGLVNWTDIVPGLDGGIIVGKQQSTWPGPIIPGLNPCELAIVTAQGTTGCFMTAPAAETNVFADASCDGSACLGRTEVKSLSLAGFGSLSGACAVGGNCPGVQKWAVTASAYSLDYAWTFPDGQFPGMKTYLHTVGDIQLQGLPVANFSFSPSLVVINAPVQFTDTSKDLDGTVMAWNWDFGDGSTSTVQNPTHTYTAVGIYTVTLRVTDNQGNVSQPLQKSLDVRLVWAGNGIMYMDPLMERIKIWFPNVAGKNITCRIESQPSNSYLRATITPDCLWGALYNSYSSLGGGSLEFTYSVSDGVSSSIGRITVYLGHIDPIVRLYDLMSATPQNTPVTWQPSYLFYPGYAVPHHFIINQPPLHGTATASASTGAYTYTPATDYVGSDYFIYQMMYDTRVANLNLQTVGDQIIQWTPAITPGGAVGPTGVVALTVGTANAGSVSTPSTSSVSSSATQSITCRIGPLPSIGTATIASDCSSGTYKAPAGFIGTDNFTYIANDGQFDSNPGLVTVAVTEPPGNQACLNQYPVSQFTQTGKEGTITISFTGNITSHTNKAVKVCPGTTLSYKTSSTQGPVACKVKNNTTRGSGMLRINDHLKCTDKPAGKDKLGFKVKSGVSK